MSWLIKSIIMISVFVSTAMGGEMSFAEFQYCTNSEVTFFGDRIRFFNGDTLWGWVHSNDQIAIMQSPVFYGLVTTSSSNFEQGIGYNPIFYQQPQFDYPRMEFPTQLTSIRVAAESQGNFFENPGGQYQFRMLFEGNQGGIAYRWPIDFPFNDSTAEVIGNYGVFQETAIFFEGELEALATDPEIRLDYGINGRVTVGASGNVWILDNLRYVDSNLWLGTVDSTTTNCFGLASEQNILIANTIENGRDNGAPSTDEWRNDVILNGAFMALGESFSFEDQNDDTSAGGGTWPSWYYSNGPSPDERGQIHLWGSLIQYRRGYVHRSNHSGTGYLKDYHYYQGIRLDPPPFFPYVEVNLTMADTLDFGTVMVGSTTTLPLFIFNNSVDTISITEAAIEPAGNFYIESITDSVLCPNETGQMTIRFNPSTNGYYTQVLHIQTDYGDTYEVRLTADVQGTGVNDMGIATVEGFRLIGVYPNPFNDSVTIQFSLGRHSPVELSIYNISGEKVYSTVSQYDSGVYNIRWNAGNNSGGIYLFRLRSESGIYSGKLLFIK